MGRQARGVHSSRSVSTFASVALVPALTDPARRTPPDALLADALRDSSGRATRVAEPFSETNEGPDGASETGEHEQGRVARVFGQGLYQDTQPHEHGCDGREQPEAA
jgi:hypothetical protein